MLCYLSSWGIGPDTLGFNTTENGPCVFIYKYIPEKAPKHFYWNTVYCVFVGAPNIRFIGQLKVNINEQECGKSMAQILTRALQLKLAHWGKSAAGQTGVINAGTEAGHYGSQPDPI